ncbi:MAG: hypothetical protein NC237_02570 [Eubacterium sp.]|nr:hypothetical protein [Eubacterium sp.]
MRRNDYEQNQKSHYGIFGGNVDSVHGSHGLRGYGALERCFDGISMDGMETVVGNDKIRLRAGLPYPGRERNAA